MMLKWKIPIQETYNTIKKISNQNEDEYLCAESLLLTYVVMP